MLATSAVSEVGIGWPGPKPKGSRKISPTGCPTMAHNLLIDSHS